MASKSERLTILRRRSDFLRLVKEGHKLRSVDWMFLSVGANQLEVTRWGWTIPGRVGNAVIRNKLKRWCRVLAKEISSESISKERVPKGYDINVVFRPQPAGFFKNMLFADFKRAFEQAIRKVRPRS